jgi:hypothetical protein
MRGCYHIFISLDIRPHFPRYVDFPHNHLDNGPQYYILVSVEGLTPDKTKDARHEPLHH